MKCEPCANKDCANCNDWQPVPESPARRLLEAIFGPNVTECCCRADDNAIEEE